MEIVGYLAMICIGLVLGMIGAGGSMLAVPVLVYFFSMSMETASGYSLFLIGTTSLAGAVMRGRQASVSLRPLILLALPSIVGAVIARHWLISLTPEVLWSSRDVVVTKDDVLLILFSLMMLASASAILLKKDTPADRLAGRKLYRLIPIGFGTGLLTGLTGSGGGFLILPALMIFAAVPFNAAASASLAVIASNSLFGFCGDMFNRSINWMFLFTLTALAIGGLALGYWCQRNVESLLSIRKVFAWLMLALAFYILSTVAR